MDGQEVSLSRWHELLHERQHCEGFAIKSRLRLFRLCLFAFDKNFESLMNAVAEMKPPDQPTDDTVFELADQTDTKMFEVCRCLQNFVSSAMTLVEQSRVLYRKMYEPDGKIPEHDGEIERRFKENGLHQFIQELRNMTVHYRLPGVGYTVNRQFTRGSSSVSYQVYLQKDDLLGYKKWNSCARRFLDNSADKIELVAVVSAYHRLVLDFHSWFAGKQREVHQQEFERLEALESELRRMADEMRRQHRERVSASLNERPSGP